MFSLPPAVSRLSSVSPQTVLIAAVMVMAAAFVWQGAHLVSAWRGTDMDGARLVIRAAGSSGSGIGLEQVAKLHLFGERAREPIVEPTTTEMPQTDLKFVLVGAMTNSDAAKASALITTDKQTSRFFVGDAIATGVVLQEVRADAVVLKRNGKLETLSFPRAAESVASVPNHGIGRPSSFVRPAQPAVMPNTRPLNNPANRFLHGNPRNNARPDGRLPAHADNQ